MVATVKLYSLIDETGIVLGYFATKQELQKEMDEWIKMGTEPSYGIITYIQNRKGVAKLLNSIKSDS